MTFQTFLITFISADCAGHVKLEICCSFFHRRVNNERCTGALSSWKMNCLPEKFLHTTGHKLSSSTFNIYESQYFRQLVPKYPLLDNKYNPRTLQIFCYINNTSKTFRSPNLVRLSPNVNFPILSFYHLSFIRK